MKKNPAGTRGRHGRELWNSRGGGAERATVACSDETDFYWANVFFIYSIKW